jgi:hypothetical protein
MKTMMALTGFAVFAAMMNPSDRPTPPTGGAVEFPHAVHNLLIQDCATCHGVATPDGSAYPEPAFCGSCHDGTVAPEVGWTPPAEAGDRRVMPGLPRTNPSHGGYVFVAMARCRMGKPPRRRSRCITADLRKLSREAGLPRLSHARYGFGGAGLSPRRLSRRPCHGGIFSRDVLLRLPQCGVVLFELPSTGGPRDPCRHRCRVSRCWVELQYRTWTSRPTGT